MIDPLAPPVWWTLGGLVLLLACASALTAMLRWRYPARDWTELSDRIKSWWVLFGVFAGAIALSRTASLVFLGLMSFLALKEFFSLIPTRRVDRKVLLWAYLAIPVQYYWIATDWYQMFLIFVPVYLFLLLPAIMVVAGETRGFLRAASSLHWGVMICVFLLGHAAQLRVVPDAGNPVAGAAGWLLFLVITTEFNDVFQYLWGKAIGRTPAAPGLSPRKTVEGALGGIATTIVFALALAQLLTPFSTPVALMAGALIGFAGFFGDLTISALKRDLGIKDSGALIPGHGGVLDRLDSLAFTAPLFFHFTIFLHY
ncbi:MAG: phosphatidate cytidylyltransferase [Azospirillaceae bacterium]